MTETVGSSAWLRRVFEEEARDDLFAGHAPQEQPVLVLLGGQPAAGKTRAQHAILAEHVADDLVEITGDDLREYHPDFRRLATRAPFEMPAATAPVSGGLVKLALDHALERRYSVLLEGTFRDPGMVTGTATRFAEAGYRVEVVAVATPAPVSRLSAEMRSLGDGPNEPGRWTPPEAHETALAGSAGVLSALEALPHIARVRVFSREAQLFDRSRRYLGPVFDIHGGGLDLRFPHHENELAQSVAAGDQFARYWVHNGLVTTNGQKMSKSLDNSVSADALLQQVSSAALRYYLLSAHYRSTLDYNQQSLTEAEAAFGRIAAFQRRARPHVAIIPTATGLPECFAKALDDDLNAPAALAVLHDHVHAGNSAIDHDDLASAAREYRFVSAMLSVLGIADEALDVTTRDGIGTTVAAVVDMLLTQRTAARDAHDFDTADRIRDELAKVGITIDDTASGPSWRTT